MARVPSSLSSSSRPIWFSSAGAAFLAFFLPVEAMATAHTLSLSATFITFTPWVERPSSEMPFTGVRTMTPSSETIMISSSGPTIFMTDSRPFLWVIVMV